MSGLFMTHQVDLGPWVSSVVLYSSSTIATDNTGTADASSCQQGIELDKWNRFWGAALLMIPFAFG